MWSADEKALYYVRDTAGVENIWSRPIAGGAPRKLTDFSSGRVLWPNIAGDGSTIVFERNFAIWRYDIASGSGPRGSDHPSRRSGRRRRRTRHAHHGRQPAGALS